MAYLGNSVTAQRESFVDPLHRIVGAIWGIDGDARRAGLGGVGSLALAGLLDDLVTRHRPRVCFVECSLADAGGATPLNRIAVAVESILGDLQAAGVVPIVLHLPRTDVSPDLHQSVIDIYNSIALPSGVQEIDVRYVAELGAFLDGVHPSAALSEVIAEAIGVQLGRFPTMGSAQPLPSGRPRVRRVPARLTTSRGRQPRNSCFRLSLESVTVETGGSILFEATASPFLGVYVIARSTSGVIELRSGNETSTVQVWDQWCSRARIQFVHLPENLDSYQGLEVAPTDSLAAEWNPQRLPATHEHRGSSIEVIAAATLSMDDHERF